MQIIETGIIKADGGVQLPMDRVRQSLSPHAGERVVVTFRTIGRKSTQAQRGYYYGYILPTIQAALFDRGARMGKDEADMMLTSEYGSECAFARDMQEEEMTDFISWLQQWAAENLEVYVEDARLI